MPSQQFRFSDSATEAVAPIAHTAVRSPETLTGHEATSGQKSSLGVLVPQLLLLLLSASIDHGHSAGRE